MLAHDPLMTEARSALARLRTCVQAMAAEGAGADASRAAAGACNDLLRVVQTCGRGDLALLVDEVALLCRSTAAAATARVQETSVAALRAHDLLQMSLERGHGHALEHVDAVNTLRGMRGAHPLLRACLLAEQPAVSATPLRQAAGRQLRAWFQHGLAGWLRGGRDESLELMRSVLARVASLCDGGADRALWRAACIYADTLGVADDEPRDPGVRRLLMQLDGALRLLADEAQARSRTEPGMLCESLLQVVAARDPEALAPRTGPRRLALLRNVAVDLADLAGTLADAAPAVQPPPMPASLRQLADRLGLLGLAIERQRLLSIGVRLRGGAKVDAELLALATELAAAAGTRPAIPPGFAGAAASDAAGLTPAGVAVDANVARLLRAAAHADAMDVVRGRLDQQLGSQGNAVQAMRDLLARLEEGLATMGRDVAPLLPAGRPGALFAERLAEVREALLALSAPLARVHGIAEGAQDLLAEQERQQGELRRMLSTQTLDALGAALTASVREVATRAGWPATLAIESPGDTLPASPEALFEVLAPLFELLVTTTPAARAPACALRLRSFRHGAWVYYRLGSGATVDDGSIQPGGRASWTPSGTNEGGGEHLLARAARAARAIGASVYAGQPPGAGPLWVRVPDYERMRELVVVRTGAERFAVPLADVLGVSRGQHTDDAEACSLRELLALPSDEARDDDSRGDTGLLAMVADRLWQVLLDDIVERRQGRVLAPVEPLRGCPWIAGSTLTGAGNVVAVLDIAELLCAHMARLEHG